MIESYKSLAVLLERKVGTDFLRIGDNYVRNLQ